jgi:hypothetical protein
LLLLVSTDVSADVSVSARCVDCLPRGNNRTVDLLFRQDENTSVDIEWALSGDLEGPADAVQLYAGNPVLETKFAQRTPFELAPVDGGYRGKFTFPAHDLGEGTFVTILVSESGERRRILDWRAWRTLTEEDQRREVSGPRRASGWELDLRPTALSLTSGRGPLPYTQGGDQAAWWSLADRQNALSDLDLDGEHTGTPGLGVVWSPVWHARQQTFLERIEQIASDVRGHRVEFEDLRWVEEPDRNLSVEGYDEATDTLRHYYTVVTLFTNASIRTFDKDEIGGRRPGNVTYFSHETSARLSTPDDARFWSSYNVREHGSDPAFLELLKDAVGRYGTISGLRQISTDDGDGGPVQYRLGFTADVRPWRESAGDLQAGFVALDVVGTRRGIGRPVTQGYTGQSDLDRAWCVVTGCADDVRAMDLNLPPRGYVVESPNVKIESDSGQIPLLDNFQYASRGPDDPPQKFPREIQFALAVSMQAGALMKMKGWRSQIVDDIVPINVYAQYVLRMTVALTSDRGLIVAAGPNLPQDPATLAASQIVTERPKPTAMDKVRGFFRGLSAFAIVAGIGIIAIFVPGFLSLLNATLSLLASAVRALDAILKRILHRSFTLRP